MNLYKKKKISIICDEDEKIMKKNNINKEEVLLEAEKNTNKKNIKKEKVLLEAENNTNKKNIKKEKVLLKAEKIACRAIIEGIIGIFKITAKMVNINNNL